MKRKALENNIVMRYLFYNVFISATLVISPISLVICLLSGLKSKGDFIVFEIILLLILFEIIHIVRSLILKRRITIKDTKEIIIDNPKAKVSILNEHNEYYQVKKVVIVGSVNGRKRKFIMFPINNSVHLYEDEAKRINRLNSIEIKVFKHSNVVDNIPECEESEYKKSIKQKRKLFEYNGGKESVFLYKEIEYCLDDIGLIFCNSDSIENVYIVDRNNNYLEIGMEKETYNSRVFYAGEMIINDWESLKTYLKDNNFIFENNILIVGGVEKSDPALIQSEIDSYK